MSGVWGPWLWAAMGLLAFCSSSGQLGAEDRAAGGAVHQPAGENLLADDRPAAALLAAEKPTGWTLSGGRLRGETSTKPLPVATLPSDFELHIAWTVTNAGAMVLEVAGADAAKPSDDAAASSWQIRLAELPGVAIKLPAGARIMKVAADTHGQRHTTVLRRAGEKLIITTDGIASRELPLPGAGPWNLSLSVAAGEGTLDWLRLVEVAAK